MNLLTKIILSFVWVCSLACNKSPITAEPKSLSIEINSSTIYSDGLDELIVTVLDDARNDITSGSEILIDNISIIGNSFKTNTTKSFTVKARTGMKESNTLSFNSVRHETNNFSKKIIVEEFAGMWCSFCTQYTYNIDTMARNNAGIIPVTIHSGDLLQYIFEPQLRNHFGISSFPSAYINRGVRWDETYTMLQNELNKKSKCGLALNTSVSNNQVTATVKVKFDITTSENLKIVVALLEDSLVFPQANFYNLTPTSPFYLLGDPIINYRHNNTLRKAATDIFGDTIPKISQKKNEEWARNYVFDASGYSPVNLKIVAFVFFSENNASRWGALNAQIVKAGGIRNYD